MENIEQLLQETGVAKTTGAEITSNFQTFFDQVKQWEEKAKSLIVENEDETDKMKQAREGRLALKNIRVSADKKRKELKEDSLRYGKAVQGVYNIIEHSIKPLEVHLENQENFTKIKREKEQQALREVRESEVDQYREFIPYGLDFGTMSEDDYTKLINGAKMQIEAREAEKLRIEAERVEAERLRIEQEEKERKEREAERKRLEAENAKLKAEREAAEKKRLAEEKERKDKEEKERIEREKKEAEHQAQLKAEREERERVEKIEREKREKLEREIAEKKRIESEKEAAEKARIEAELNKGDAAKVKDMINDLEEIKTRYSFKSTKNTKMYNDVCVLIDKVINHIK